jgi:hypothetical protein
VLEDQASAPWILGGKPEWKKKKIHYAKNKKPKYFSTLSNLHQSVEIISTVLT